jgi:pilus assembly protein CpaF
VTSFQEVNKVSEGECLQEIFRFEQTHLDEHGKVHGVFKATGIEPKCVSNFPALGIDIREDLFDPSNVHIC